MERIRTEKRVTTGKIFFFRRPMIEKGITMNVMSKRYVSIPAPSTGA
jgi:hypothetical protein